jgi:hypothetical protein
MGVVAADVGGGIRAIEHLAQMLVEAVPLRNTTVLPFVNNAFDEQDRPKSPVTVSALQIALDDLA